MTPKFLYKGSQLTPRNLELPERLLEHLFHIPAQQVSKVGPIPGVDQDSFAGFITVNKTTNSNMYFWFFPSQASSLSNVSTLILLVVQYTTYLFQQGGQNRVKGSA